MGSQITRDRPTGSGAPGPDRIPFGIMATALLDRCLALEWRPLLALYAELQADSPEHTTIPARALRQKARAGELPEEVIPLLTACLVDAEPPGAIADLAKALAAFGRRAELAVPFLMDKMRYLQILDDESFWAFDGCLHAMGFIGEPQNETLLDELAGIRPAPMSKKPPVYTGEIPVTDRELLFAETLERVRALLADETSDGWKIKRTDRTAKRVKPKGKQGFWMVRGK